MSDNPDLDGTASAWTGAKGKFEVLLETQGLDELVNIKDEDAHGLNIDMKKAMIIATNYFIQY